MAGTLWRLVRGSPRGGFGLLTVSTLLLSDWVVYRSDWAVLGTFSGVPCVSAAWNAVRVPPRAQHSPSSEGVFALTCVQSLWSGPSDARLAGFGLAAAVAYSGGWVAGSGSWLVGPPLCSGWGYAVPRSGSVWLVVDGQHLFMVQDSGYDMMKPALVCGSLLEGCSRP